MQHIINFQHINTHFQNLVLINFFTNSEWINTNFSYKTKNCTDADIETE